MMTVYIICFLGLGNRERIYEQFEHLVVKIVRY
jgi:hypothetical protein